MKAPIIKTNKYTIRPFKKEDALLWQIWDVDPDIQEHMPEPVNELEAIEEQYKYIEECELDEEGYYWSIETNDNNTIGTVSLFEIDEYHKSAEISIVIGDKEYWGKGVVTEVLEEVIKHAFDNLYIVRIDAEIEKDNISMKKVFEKVGFEQDGLFKNARSKNGGRVDVLHFGYLKG